MSCINIIGSVAVLRVTDPCCPLFSKSSFTARFTRREPQMSLRKRLKSASNRCIILSRVTFGCPMSFSIIMLTALLHLEIVIPCFTVTFKNVVRHLSSLGSCTIAL